MWMKKYYEIKNIKKDCFFILTGVTGMAAGPSFIELSDGESEEDLITRGRTLEHLKNFFLTSCMKQNARIKHISLIKHIYILLNFCEGPGIYGMQWFDKYCDFGNDIEMNTQNLKHLQQEVRSYKPDIPYYVCKTAKTTTNLTWGKMVQLQLPCIQSISL
jgi:hypothetical protein